MVFQDPQAALNPVMKVGDQIVEAMTVHGVEQAGRARAGDRAARTGRHPGRPDEDRPLPAPVLRRHAPARRHRDRPGERPRAADRRRADHRSRRHHPGADPAPARQAAHRTRHRHRDHHPRHGRRRRDCARTSSSCTAAARSRRGPSSRSSSVRGTPTPRRCWRPCPGSTTTGSAGRCPRSPAAPPDPAAPPAGCAFAPRCRFAEDGLRAGTAGPAADR